MQYFNTCGRLNLKKMTMIKKITKTLKKHLKNHKNVVEIARSRNGAAL